MHDIKVNSYTYNVILEDSSKYIELLENQYHEGVAPPLEWTSLSLSLSLFLFLARVVLHLKNVLRFKLVNIVVDQMFKIL